MSDDARAGREGNREHTDQREILLAPRDLPEQQKPQLTGGAIGLVGSEIADIDLDSGDEVYTATWPGIGTLRSLVRWHAVRASNRRALAIDPLSEPVATALIEIDDPTPE